MGQGLTPQEEQTLAELKAQAEALLADKLTREGGERMSGKITTREGSRLRAEGEDAGGLEAGPWYMDVAKDVLNPFDLIGGVAAKGMRSSGQLAKKAYNATGGKVLQGAADQHAMVKMVGEGTDLAPHAKGQVDAAIQGIRQNKIAPKDAALRGLIKGDMGEISPEQVGRLFPRYAKKLAEKRGVTQQVTETPINSGVQFYDEVAQPSLGLQTTTPGAVPEFTPPTGQLPLFQKGQTKFPFDAPSGAPGPSTTRAADATQSFGKLPTAEQYGLPLLQRTVTETPVTTGRVAVPKSRLLRLKRAADSEAKYPKNQAPFSEGAAARKADAKAVADSAREEIYKTPGAEDILSGPQGMDKDIKLANFLRKRSETDPVGLLKAHPGTTRDSLLARASKDSGVNLRKTGDQIERGAELQLQPRNLFKPLTFTDELRKVGERGALAVGGGLNSAAKRAAPYVNASRLPEVGSWEAAKAGMGMAVETSPEVNASTDWTPDDEHELNTLKQMLQQYKQGK
jgi:hypothetical protein